MHRVRQAGNNEVSAALRIVDDAWTELKRSPFTQLRMGVTPTRLPDVSIAEAERRSRVGSELLKRLDQLNVDELHHDLALTLRLVRFRAKTWSREADWYWLVIDPRGIGSFGAFLPAAYCGAYLLNLIHNQLSAFQFHNSGDLDRYLALVADYAQLIDQFTERTNGQATRGIYMPRVQVHQARTLLSALKASVRSNLQIAPQRVAGIQASCFMQELESRIGSGVEPAFDRAREGLSDSYFENAPEAVGIGQYPGGAEVYAELVKLYTTLDITPEEVHARGHERMAQIEASMEAIRTASGFPNDSAGFLQHLQSQPDWRATNVEEVAAVFQRYINRIEGRLHEFFAMLPSATCGVAPLPEAVQGSMTFGYYDAPKKDRPEGRYLFNPRHLTKQALFNIGALTYHELIPGHHLHLASQQENGQLHPFRAHSFVTAYVEGWAEYAAFLAGEIGMYELPEERYGRLVMDAFLTSRLVVDTGMNALGWSLGRARDYMRRHSGMSEAEIQTESIRYSCDYIGQALAYKLGDAEILALRERMRTALGARFDLKTFHTAILSPGAMPLPDLAWHVEYEIEKCSREQ